MVGHLVLAQAVGVRILLPQQEDKTKEKSENREVFIPINQPEGDGFV